MKHFMLFNEGRSLLSRLVLFLTLILGGTTSVWAEELTVYDGNNTNSYIAFWAGQANNALKCEFVIPAEDLASMEGTNIRSMTFYATTNNTLAKPSYGSFQIFLKEIDNATPYKSSSSSYQGLEDATIVYEGNVSVSSNEMLITFTTDYIYHGGNLLIGFYKEKGGIYLSSDFYGVNQTGYTGCYKYNSADTGLAGITSGSGAKFIPKTTFTYEEVSSYKRPANLTATSITSESAIISWSAGSNDDSETSWDLEYKTSVSDVWNENYHGISKSTLTQTLSGLSANTTYDVRVKAHYDGENESGWNVITFKTEKTSTPALGFYDDFETDKGWELINGTMTNKWARGTAVNNGGSYALYISNDNGNTNASTAGATMVYVAKYFAFTTGQYLISYDWRANGEDKNDYLRVALVPANVELTGGFSTPTNFSYNGLPTGWVAIDGGSQLNLTESWQTKTVTINILSDVRYYLVFAWRSNYTNNYNPPAAIDNLRILPSTTSATLGTNGYTTFASPWALDLTAENLPSGLKAYKASVDGSKVRFSEIDQAVPANTGILLEGVASESYNIPVAVSGTVPEENAFLVNSVGGTFDKEDNYTYFALKKDSNPLSFWTFNPSTAAIPSNKAYLKVETTFLARGLTLTFDDDEETGIEGVENEKLREGEKENAIFNLAGQRVSKAQKGLYIVNGRKLMVK